MARLLGYISRKDDWIDAVAQFLVKPIETVLDIGCGIRPEPYIVPADTHFLADPYQPYLDRALSEWPYGTSPRAEAIAVDWDVALQRFEPGGVDTIFLLDVIEHLEKERAFELLERTVAAANRQVVTFTPLGFLAQEPEDSDAWGFAGTGHLQTHRSGWEPSDFDDRWGYLISPGFHQIDNHGRPFESGPRDAWWGILTK